MSRITPHVCTALVSVLQDYIKVRIKTLVPMCKHVLLVYWYQLNRCEVFLDHRNLLVKQGLSFTCQLDDWVQAPGLY
ncbi:hypothetical protein PR048_003990 [Dryococelus australis]|uniref:Uncharacterized protein n=1 Tax=Dryococelus australis TaxID=614101 RepID=A0ABQ9I496_9NEOP|nr:hypothetical protein PR048_003990 [Dryococelus australis]